MKYKNCPTEQSVIEAFLYIVTVTETSAPFRC